MSSKMGDYHTRLRAEIGEETYLERMAAIRAARKKQGGAFRLDYVAPDGRTGSEIATEVGRAGARARSKRRNELES